MSADGRPASHESVWLFVGALVTRQSSYPSRSLFCVCAAKGRSQISEGKASPEPRGPDHRRARRRATRWDDISVAPNRTRSEGGDAIALSSIRPRVCAPGQAGSRCTARRTRTKERRWSLPRGGARRNLHDIVREVDPRVQFRSRRCAARLRLRAPPGGPRAMSGAPVVMLALALTFVSRCAGAGRE